MDEDFKEDVNDAISILAKVCRIYGQVCKDCPLYNNVCRGEENGWDFIPVNWEDIK